MVVRNKAIILLVMGALFITAGIFRFLYSRKLAFEWPKNKFLRFILIYDWNRIADRKNNTILIFLYKFLGVIAILIGLTCIIVAILTFFGKF